MHEDIHRVSLTGIIDPEVNIVEQKERLIHFLESQARDEGYVPALDLEPQFTRKYLPESEEYEFFLSAYVIHVGEDKSWDVAGIMGGKTIMKSTPQTK